MKAVSVLAEPNDEWAIARRRMSAESIAKALADPLAESAPTRRTIEAAVGEDPDDVGATANPLFSRDRVRALHPTLKPLEER